MTLQEAIATGKRFTRSSMVGTLGWFGAEDIGDAVILSASDVTATDYVLEPSEITLSVETFTRIWDEVAAASTNVKSSASSPLYAKLKSKLFNS